jgi:aryl-alcohol dehydrogenase-like predicted oxidoreductase
MRYRKFGNTDLTVSEIGFGAWAIGGAARVGQVPIGWGATNDDTSRKAIMAALDAGINFFDTADFYGLGHSESLLGEVLASQPQALIASKVGQKVGATGNIDIDYSSDYILQACEQSLKRLRRDCIDFYQLHVARLVHLENGECLAAMEQLKQQGKIRYWGLSLNTYVPGPEAEWLIAHQQASGFQLVLNLINQIAIPILEKAAQQGYGIIARMPLQFGLLSGKIKSTHTFESEDHRSFRLTPNIIQQTLDVLRVEVLPLAKQYNTTLAGIALGFVLGFDAVSTVIPGIRTPDHVALNTSGLVQLSAHDKAHLQALFTTRWPLLLHMIQQHG